MSILFETLQEYTSHTKLTIPDELFTLYQWIESNGMVTKEKDGRLYGRLNKSWSFSPEITFNTEPKEEMTIGWVTKTHLVTEMTSRLCFFADSGMDGSRLGLWLTDSGDTVFIHLGSGSGSSLACVIAENALDFIRLLGVGYHSLGDVYDFGQTPHYFYEENRTNPTFCRWIEETYKTVIPETGIDIVKEPSDFLSDDP